MVTYATKALAVAADFDTSHGSTVDDDYEFVFELLFKSGSNWEWFDATGYVLGLDVTRGAPVVGGEYAAGYGFVELDSPAHLFAPWNDSTASFEGKGAQYGPDIVWRYGYHDGGTGHWQQYTGVVEQWAPFGDELCPTVILTVTDTIPVLARQGVAGLEIAGGTTIHAHIDAVFDTQITWPFGYTNNATSVVTAATSELVTSSAAAYVRRLARSNAMELRANRLGQAVIGDAQRRSIIASWIETKDPIVELNTYNMIANTLRHTPDTSGVVNDVDIDNIDGDGPATDSDATSITLHGNRLESRTDYVVDLAANLTDLASRWADYANLKDRIIFELDDRALDTIVDLDLGQSLEVTHAPRGAPVGVTYGVDGSTYFEDPGLCWTRQLRHRITPNGANGWNISCEVTADVFGYVTYTGVNLMTCDGDQLRDDAANDLLTPQRNLIHA